MARPISFGGGLVEAPEPRYMRQRAMADALMQQSQGPISGWGEGVANLARTAAAGFIGKRADQAEKTESQARADLLRQAVQSGDFMGTLGQSDDPWAQGITAQYAMAQALEKPADKWTPMTDAQETAMGLPTAGSYLTNTSGDVKSIYDAPKPKSPISIAGRLVDPDDPTKVLADFSAEEAALRQAGASSTTNNISVSGDKKNAQTIGEYWGKKLGDIMDAGFKAPQTIAQYQRLGTLLDQVGTGTFTKSTVEFKKALKGAGIDPESLGITDNTSVADAAEAISNQLTMEMRNPQGGAGMPGAMSDADRNFLQATVPNLGKTPGGNALLVQYRVKIAQRDAEVAKMANDYARANDGIIDGGFFDQLQQWSEANPLFGPEDQPAPPPPSAMGGAGSPVVVDGYTITPVQ